CGHLDEPALSITFERVEPDTASRSPREKVMCFRLTNNANCTLLIPLTHEYLAKTPDRGYTFYLKNNLPALVAYELHGGPSRSPRHRRGIVFARQMTSPTPLSAGISVLF